MAYHFQNLVMEGGGVKGIAYLGSLSVLEQKGVLKQIKRVGGASAGAINAVLFALGYSGAEMQDILWKMRFREFEDDSFGLLRDGWSLLQHFGWNKGDVFQNWIRELIARKTGNANLTFAELKAKGAVDLSLVGTNLSTSLSQLYNHETAPTMKIADAVRISMSIPLFYRAVKSAEGHVLVDGGVLQNYPVKLYDEARYLSTPEHGKKTEYYEPHNAQRPTQKKYLYNMETLGFRLDSAEEIAVFQGHAASRPPKKIGNIVQYARALMETLLYAQENTHLHSDDWQRTIYIDTLGVKTTEFDITDAKKQALVDSGRKCTEAYFAWYDKAAAANKPD